MSSIEVGLILGLAAIIAVLLAVLVAVLMGRKATATLDVAQIVHARVVVGAAERAAASEAVRTASEQKGGTARDAGTQVIEQTTVTRLARVLWVDDNPDYNLYETVALERLGLFVTKATSTAAGEFYLNALSISLVVTDLRRGGDPNAGRDLLAKVRASRPELPVIIYTTGADAKRDDLLAAGAADVADLPGDLVAAVLRHRPQR